mgnify:CR=1 FL=1
MKKNSYKKWETLAYVSQPIIILDSSFKVVWINYSALKLINLSRKADERPLCELFTADTKACPVRGFFIKNDDNAKNLEFINLLKNQSDITYSISPLKGEGDDSGWFVSIEDVSRNNELRKFVTRTYKLFESIFNASPYGLLVVNDELRVINLNRKAENLIKVPKDDVLGKFCSEIEAFKTIDDFKTSLNDLIKKI